VLIDGRQQWQMGMKCTMCEHRHILTFQSYRPYSHGATLDPRAVMGGVQRGVTKHQQLRIALQKQGLYHGVGARQGPDRGNVSTL